MPPKPRKTRAKLDLGWDGSREKEIFEALVEACKPMMKNFTEEELKTFAKAERTKLSFKHMLVTPPYIGDTDWRKALDDLKEMRKPNEEEKKESSTQ